MHIAELREDHYELLMSFPHLSKVYKNHIAIVIPYNPIQLSSGFLLVPLRGFILHLWHIP